MEGIQAIDASGRTLWTSDLRARRVAIADDASWIAAAAVIRHTDDGRAELSVSGRREVRATAAGGGVTCISWHDHPCLPPR